MDSVKYSLILANRFDALLFSSGLRQPTDLTRRLDVPEIFFSLPANSRQAAQISAENLRSQP